MKAITLWQPWATLVALGVKRIETRNWSTLYRGKIAIHAAKAIPRSALRDPRLTAIVLDLTRTIQLLDEEIPLGAVVACARLVACRPTIEVVGAISSEEQSYGDYSPGRFAWLLEDVVKLDRPVPARGGQRLWNWGRAA